MRAIQAALLCLLSFLSASFAAAAFAAGTKIVCDAGMETMFLRVKAKYGNFTQPVPGENLEQRVLFNEFFNLYNQHILAGESWRLASQMLAEAKTLDAAMARLQQKQNEFAEYQNLLPPSQRESTAMPALSGTCASGYTNSLAAFERQVSMRLAELSKAMKAKLDQACAAQDAEEITTAGSAASGGGLMKLVQVDPSNSGDGWTVTEGRIELKRPGYSGTWSWAALPDEIGPKGFARTLIARAQADKGMSMTTAIEFTTTLETINPPPKNYITAKGNTETQSVVMIVEPPQTLRKGDKYKITIGAAWGPQVTYHYVVK